MDRPDTISCPVSDCSYSGTLSRVIHHVTDQNDSEHTWDALGFRHSGEFRDAHAEGGATASPEPDTATASSEPDSGSTDTSPSTAPERLARVPGIGETRAAALSEAGYTDVEDVARAPLPELARVSTVSDSSAEAIRVVAREECGYETFVTELATELNAERAAVADAYGTLAGVTVTPDEARPTLVSLFGDSPDDSVTELTEYSVRYRHFLLEAGFERVQDVATASIDELTAVPYLGTSLATKIRDHAREVAEKGGSDTATGAADGRREETDRGSGTQTERTDAATNADTSTDSSGTDPDTAGTGSDTAGAGSAGSPDADTERSFPPALKQRDQWLLWKTTDDGRKIPRAPWETGDPLQYVSATDPSNWVSFAEARQWQSKLPHGLELAFVVTRGDDLVFLDLDDVVHDGGPTQAAQALVDQSGSYTAVSTSGTGLHLFVHGSLSDGVKSLTGPLDDDERGRVEVYDRSRFVALTGNHLAGTPRTVADGEELLDDLEAQFASVSSETPDRGTVEPRRSREQLRDIETTHDIQDVFDAVQQTRPKDIRMRSTRTEQRGDGTCSYDPSWVDSESGTRLAVLEDGWIYREGMVALDALQLVALEDGLLTDVRAYPEGDTFWEAVDRLRDRGAHIPEFEPADEPVDEATAAEATTALDRDADIDPETVAERLNYGEPVRTDLHRFDRDYQERLALELAPTFVDAAESLHLPATVVYRAATLYAKAHAAGIVAGAAHESTIGSGFRIASIEAGTPRPLQDIADAVGESPRSIRNKFQRLMQETDLSETFSASDLIVAPSDYVPYTARQLGVDVEQDLCATVETLLEAVETDGSSNPMSEVAAAFYVAMNDSDAHSTTQSDIAYAAGLTEVTIRNNYRKYAAAIDDVPDTVE